MYEPHNLTSSDDDFTARLRAARPTSPRLDRDRLMYLAGQRSIVSGRKVRPFWPALAAVSWVACAGLVGLAFNQPPVVVTETKVLERTVEVPVGIEAPAAVASDHTPTAPVQMTENGDPPFDFGFLDNLQQPLTALASRPELFMSQTPSVAVATIDTPHAAVEPKEPQTYGKLRREWLGGEHDRETPPRALKWF